MTRPPQSRFRLLPVVLTAFPLAACSTLPELSRDHYREALEARAGDDCAEAVRLLSVAIDVSGNRFFARALLERGECRLELAATATDPDARGEYFKAAVRDLQAVAAHEDADPVDRARALRALGDSYVERGRTAAATEHFDRLLAIEPAALDTSEELREYRLKAHRALGWLTLGPILSRLARRMSAEPDKDPETDEALRAAQEHFSLALEIDADDPRSNLGRGICLQLRGQPTAAVPLLKRALSREGPASWGPEGPFYLARAMEGAAGFQKEAVEHYDEALLRDSVLRDPERSFLPLYAHLAAYLPVYVRPEDPEFRSWIRRLLEYRRDERAYWSRLIALGEELARSPETAGLGYEILALVFSRRGEVDAAVESLAAIRQRSDFDELVDRVFPDEEPMDAERAYGRTRVLFEAGRHEDLEEWFDGGAGVKLQTILTRDPGTPEAEYARKALVLHARNIFELSKVSDDRARGDTTRLVRVRDILVAAADRGEQDFDARLLLAAAYAELGSGSTALEHYESLVDTSTTDLRLFRALLDFHRAAEKESARAAAWRLLRRYSGGDGDIRDYLAETRRRISAVVGRHCIGCGRARTLPTERRCMECGRSFPADVSSR